MLVIFVVMSCTSVCGFQHNIRLKLPMKQSDNKLLH